MQDHNSNGARDCFDTAFRCAEAAETFLQEEPLVKAAAFQLALGWYALARFSAEKGEIRFDAASLAYIDRSLLRLPRPLTPARWEEEVGSWFALSPEAIVEPSLPFPIENWSLRRHCAGLRRTAAAIRRCAAKKHAPWRWRLVRAAKVACSAALLAVLAGFYYSSRERGPWLVSYYDNPELTGEPASSGRMEKIDHDWTWVGPLTGFPADNYGVRWETRLYVDRPQKVVFDLASDDGSRLYVDDRMVIDHWSAHPFVSAQAEVDLNAGQHSIRLDYFQLSASAQIRLLADFGDGMKQVPLPMLHFPGH